MVFSRKGSVVAYSNYNPLISFDVLLKCPSCLSDDHHPFVESVTVSSSDESSNFKTASEPFTGQILSLWARGPTTMNLIHRT